MMTIGIIFTLMEAMIIEANLAPFKISYPNPDKTESFRHMVADISSGFIYVAGVNKIVKLSENLTVEQLVKTGPKEDDPKCLPHELNICKTKKQMDSYSKALTINYIGKRLIACSSLFQGVCTKYWLSDISKYDSDSSRYEYVVANNATATTFAFIAPGPPMNGVTEPVIYLGTTYTSNGLSIVRKNIPAFCSRNLNTLAVTKKSLASSTAMFIDAQYRPSFYVKYIYGFSSDGFSYMATVQRAGTQSDKYITKLIRVCQNDDKFWSYTEVELVCEHNGAKYNLLQAARLAKPGKLLAEALTISNNSDVLFATFSISKLGSAEPLNDTAICVYPMKTITEIFTKNIRKCFEGTGNTGPDHFVRRTPCLSATHFLDNITLDYCGFYEINQPIDGSDPIAAKAAVTIRTMVSAITVIVSHDYTIGFIGTQNGHILKVVIESQDFAHMYEDIVVENRARIHEDMVFDMAEKHLFVMTNKKIYKLALHDCDQYESCGSCQNAIDPFCGCRFVHKCSLRGHCSEHKSYLRWFEYNGDTCPTITSIYPDKIQNDNKDPRTNILTLNISNLPTGPFKCQFSGYNQVVETAANRTSAISLTCETPLPYQLPQFPPDEDHIMMTISVLSKTGLNVSTNVTFFDCEVHNKSACYKCSLSKFNCTWCIRNHVCTHSPLRDCNETDEFVAAMNSEGFLYEHTAGPDKCPRISKDTVDMLVPSGKTKSVALFAHNLRSFQYPVYCYFSIRQGKFVTARLKSINSDSEKMIECDEIEFSYTEETNLLNVSFTITWGKKDLSKALDNPGGIQVKIYKCDIMAESCGQCLFIPVQYNCGWCDSRCSIQDNCEDSIWLNSSSTCPNPLIHSINPLCGPTFGGTKLTIKGENLGRTYADISSFVDVNGISCSPLQDRFEPPSKIVCITTEYFDMFSKRGHVRVTVNGQYSAESERIFTYVAPKIKDFSPDKGILAGNTTIVLSGNDLGCIELQRYSISFCDDYLCIECKVYDSSENDQLSCRTSATDAPRNLTRLEGIVDSAHLALNKTFRYLPDPYINNVTVLSIQSYNTSCETKLDILGEGFNNVGRVTVEKMEDPCEILSDTKVLCKTPELGTTAHISLEGLVNRIVMHFDGLTKHVYVQINPTFERFEGDVQYNGVGMIDIKGRNILIGAKKADYSILIGLDGSCGITKITMTSISCFPPKYVPRSIHTDANIVTVVVRLKGVDVSIGDLRYSTFESKSEISKTFVWGLVAAFVVALGIVTICVYVLKKKTRKSQELNRKSQEMIDRSGRRMNSHNINRSRNSNRESVNSDSIYDEIDAIDEYEQICPFQENHLNYDEITRPNNVDQFGYLIILNDIPERSQPLLRNDNLKEPFHDKESECQKLTLSNGDDYLTPIPHDYEKSAENIEEENISVDDKINTIEICVTEQDQIEGLIAKEGTQSVTVVDKDGYEIPVSNISQNETTKSH